MTERAVLVTVDLGRRGEWSAAERSAELAELARSAGANVVREVIVRMKAPQSAFFIGSGKAEEIGALCASEDAHIAIFNNDLSGTQQKNLEKAIGAKTIDRTQLILDIFARRAHSNEGKVQVELAQLLYLLPRLTGKGVQLSRLGGGIGTRGPGEQKLEIDRRRIRSRIDHLRASLERLHARRGMMRKKREQFSLLSVAIIGYTNAGKSTLLNALTDSRVVVADKLFATLDPRVRQFMMPNKQKVLFADTVGFLNDLPHHLIESFKATLEEVIDADLLIHVVDASHPKAREQSDAVYRVLEELGAKGKPIITVLNKADKVPEPAVMSRLAAYFDHPLIVSALKGQGLDALIGRVQDHMDALMTRATFTIPAGNARLLSVIHENGRILSTEYRDDTVILDVELPRRFKGSIDKLLTA